MIKFKNILIRLLDFKISILTKLKNILLSCVFIFGSLSLSGCYTQLSMFHPEVETETTEQFYETYSRAVPRLSVSSYAQDGAGTPLGLAYGSMYNRFQPYYGFGYGYGRDGYYNSYGTYYGYDSYLIGGYTMYIPVNTGERKPRTWTRDTKSSGTNLTTTRTRTNTNESTNNGGYSNSSNITSTRSTTSSTSTNSSSNSGGRRVTKRH